jgi:hypothetical protein
MKPTSPNRYERDSSGHVWIRPAGSSGRAREFRALNGFVQERLTSEQAVIHWQNVTAKLEPCRTTARNVRHLRPLMAHPGNLLAVVQRAHKASLLIENGAMMAAYLTASRGE